MERAKNRMKDVTPAEIPIEAEQIPVTADSENPSGNSWFALRGRACALHREMFGIIGASGSDFGLQLAGIGDMPKNCSGYCTRRTLGVQLELGAAASPFEDRDFPSGGSGTIVRDRGAGRGAHRGVSSDLPRTSSCSPAEHRARELPGELIRTIVRLPDRTGHGPVRIFQ